MAEVFVLMAFYYDKSGCQILGVYSTLSDAEDRQTLIKSAGGGKEVRVIKMPVNQASPQEVF